MDKEICLRESPMPSASKAFQALVHNNSANPVARNESDDSKTILRSPTLHKKAFTQFIKHLGIDTRKIFLLYQRVLMESHIRDGWVTWTLYMAWVLLLLSSNFWV